MTWEQVMLAPGDAGVGIVPSRFAERRMARQSSYFRVAEGVFTFSEWAAASVRRTNPDAAVVVVPPGVNVTGARRTTVSGSRILFVGRDFARKGGPLLLEAYALVKQSIPHAVLTIAGPDRWPLATEVPDGVAFEGPVGPARLKELLETADVFAMPSSFEAFGIVYVEALAAGLPCVARDVCAVREIIVEGESGALTHDDSPETLAVKLIETLENEELHRRVMGAVDDVIRRYSWDEAARVMLQAMLPGHGVSA